jgi:CBS domain-containing protein
MPHDPKDDLGDETYFEKSRQRPEAFDVDLIRGPLSGLPVRRPLCFTADATVTVAMRAMQKESRGCVLVTDDGTQDSKLLGIFTERDVLFRIVDKGRNPAALPIGDVMTADPEALPVRATVAYALNKMSIGGFRHVPVVDDEFRPAFVVSVRDIVEYLVLAFPREILTIAADFGPKGQRSREGA